MQLVVMTIPKEVPLGIFNKSDSSSDEFYVETISRCKKYNWSFNRAQYGHGRD